jgi:hypothetical protein
MTSRSVSRRGLKESGWAQVKALFAQLYKVEKRPLKDVMREIEKKYAFVAT